MAEPGLPARARRGLVNDIGDWSLAVALPEYVFTQTHSGRDTAAIFVLEVFVGIAVGPYGGTRADRWDLRRTIVATNVFQVVALLPLLAVTRHRLWPAFVVIAVETMLRPYAPVPSTPTRTT